MLGAIIGDIAGSRFEWHNIKTKQFELLSKLCTFTDDTVMTLAVAKAILAGTNDLQQLSKNTIIHMQALGGKYPDRGYGGSFGQWLHKTNHVSLQATAGIGLQVVKMIPMYTILK